MFRSFRYGCLAAAVLFAAAGCEDTTPNPTTPTDPVLVTDTFTGILPKGGGVTFAFPVSSSGPVTATLTALATSDLVVGLALGTWDGTACTITVARDSATQGAQVQGQAGSFGSLCVRIYDVGNVIDPQDFTITVAHP